MVKPFGADDEVKCPKCGGAMYLVRRAPHSARPGHERQTIECAQCRYSTLRTVDEAGRGLDRPPRLAAFFAGTGVFWNQEWLVLIF